MGMSVVDDANAAAAALREKLAGRTPQLGLILGSGLTPERLPLTNTLEIPTAEIPGLPLPTVAGHRAVWTAAELAGVPILIAGGRSHRYEGLPLATATLSVRAMRRAGCSSLIVTNAAGGIHPDLVPGTLMRIRD
ncbi:MAG: purine-nucleoside phosphorylase, partial [Planctomycetota bacterium]